MPTLEIHRRRYLSHAILQKVGYTALKFKEQKLIGKGLTAEVFTWGPDRVLKLLFPWLPKSGLETEFAVTQAVHAAGAPVPYAFEMIQVNDRPGIVLERIEGPSMLQQVERRPWTLFAAARKLAELHFQLHSYPAADHMPAQADQMQKWVDGAVDFTQDQKKLATQIIQELPNSRQVCHGDFHPANILISAKGPIIIDWSTGTRGHPVADVARTSVLFEHAQLPEGTPFHILLLMKVARTQLHSTYLKRYSELHPGTLDQIEKWRIPLRMAASAWRAERKALLERQGQTI